ncbi:MAG: DUF262 domain-containing protein [Terriglobales bacterium]|jgi:uncharacterized protein with ParB-like and HNH nuclease domain
MKTIVNQARKSEGGRFLKYFGPLLDALRTLGGSGTPDDAVERIVLDLGLSDETRGELLASGESRLRNQVAWARFYLVQEGLIDASLRGTWSLTERGRSANISLEEAKEIRRRWVRFFQDQRHTNTAGTDGEEETTMADGSEVTWFEDYADEGDDVQIEEYDITAAPNDFNVLTIYSFLESGAVRIPGFQRNYVWDLGRASKLIESLILGLPVPQVFLYEIERNKFLVIDGQQRLMSIYYFIKQRFPRKDKRAELRNIFDEHGKIPENVIHDDSYFENFRLKLSETLPNHPNRFKGLSYATLGSYKTQLELRTIRNVIIKQNSPQGDDSSMFEVFNRLNTGGINLKPQEIRTSMYHSTFYEMLYRANSLPAWRRLLAGREPDLHMKDVEILLRGFAVLIDVENYAPSMVKFLNQFSRKCRAHNAEQNRYLSDMLQSFLQACSDLPENAFLNKRNGRFNVALYESAFAASCEAAFREKRMPNGRVSDQQLAQLETDKEFLDAMLEGTTQTKNVKARLDRAKAILAPL